MIVVDTSAVIAVILRESNWEAIVRTLLADPERLISPVSLLEATMVLSRTHSEANAVIEEYLLQASISVQTIDSEQARWAAHAFLVFGKGRNAARLNLGDCFAYAAAKALSAPLLYVGDDFARTDIQAA